MSVVQRADSIGRERFHAKVHVGGGTYRYGRVRDTRKQAEADEAKIRERPTGGRKPKPEGDYWLYRVYDSQRVLLYVGITGEGLARFKQHATRTPWWREVAEIKVTHYLTLRGASRAEIRAIQHERPEHNIVHVGPPSVVEVLYGRCRSCGAHFLADGKCPCKEPPEETA